MKKLESKKNEEAEIDHEEAPFRRSLITNQTSFEFINTNVNSSESEPLSLPDNISSYFGGYHTEVQDSLSFVRLGLGMESAFQLPNHVSFPFKLPKGLLLVGSSGTGKTLLLHHICERIGCRVLHLSSSLLLHKYSIKPFLSY